MKFQPDQGWSWVILLSAFACNIIFDGIIFSFGIFLIEFFNSFQSTHASASWIGSVISAVYALVGPLASFLTKKYGCRITTIIGSLLSSIGFILTIFCKEIWQVIISYGIIGGTGFGLMYLSSYVMIGEYFEKWRAFATGLASCGSGVGTFIFAYLSVFLIDKYGWKGALLLQSAIILQGCVIGMTFRPISIDEDDFLKQKLQSEKSHKLMDFKIMKNKLFQILALSSQLCLVGFYVPTTFLPDYAITRSLNPHQTALLLSIFGIANTFGRIMSGFVIDVFQIDSLKLYCFALISGGCLTMFVGYFTTFWQLAIFSFVYGLSLAAYVCLCAIILIDLFGLNNLSNSFGFLNVFRGIGTFIGAPLAGTLYDIFENYTISFYIAGASILIAGLVCMPLRCIERRMKVNEKQPLITDNEIKLYTTL